MLFLKQEHELSGQLLQVFSERNGEMQGAIEREVERQLCICNRWEKKKKKESQCRMLPSHLNLCGGGGGIAFKLKHIIRENCRYFTKPFCGSKFFFTTTEEL